MRHVVADAVGHPAERQFAQVARAQHQRVVLVGQAEQVRGPLACLHVLKRHVIHRLAPGERVADVAEHLLAGRPDINLARRDAQRLHQLVRVAQRVLAGGETRASCRPGCSSAAAPAGPSSWRRR